MNKSISKYFLLVFALMFSLAVSAQDVKGSVSDVSGGLPGVSVMVKGTVKGVETDFDGNFNLKNLKPEDVLIFSFLGYKTKSVSVNGKSVINVELEEDLNTLDEVVVVGYGAKKKSLVTGAISSIDSEDIKSVSNQRVEQVLQGRTSGVTVSSSSGSPGSGAQIRIRGNGSTGNADPLFIVDGMKVSTIDNIAPSDIANMEVLKDASSAAIYGTEGANGVIIITTKKGNEGGIKVSFNTQLGLQFVNTPLELMNASQFVTYMNEAGITGVVDNGYDTNWVDETFQTALTQRYDLSLSGGTKSTSYYFSASHTNQDGVIGGNNSNFKRNTFRLNVKSNVTKWLELGINSNTSFINRRGVQENSDTRSVIQNLLILDPLTPATYANGDVPQSVTDLATENGVPLLTNEDGDVYGYPSFSTGEVINPLAYTNGINNSIDDNDQFLTTVYAKFNILEGLSFTSRYGYEQNQFLRQTTNIPYYVSSEASNNLYTLSQEKERFRKWLWENFATYDKSFGNHNLKLLAGYSAEQSRRPAYKGYFGTSDVDEFTGYDDIDLEENFEVLIYRDNLVSMFGRLSYDYMGKYLFEASIRRDQSDKFPTANKAGVFPAFSGGWVVSKEDFWSADAGVNYFKLRGSWGQNGSKSNLPGNSDITAITRLAENDREIDFLGNTGAQITGFANPDLVWETSEQIGVGLDLKALNNKLTFSADYYQKSTKDLIVINGDLITPPSAGFPFESFNGGTIVNEGLEFELGYAESYDSGFSFGINANLSTLKNEVTEIKFVPEGSFLEGAGAPQNDDGITRLSEGLPAWYFYGFETDGIDPTTGEINIVDTDGVDGITAADKTFIGSPHPDILYGGNISLGYKAFDFNMQFQGTVGNDIVATYHQPSRAITNKPVAFFDGRWTGVGDTDAIFPSAIEADTAYDTDLVVEDGSYMRIKQIQLGYTLPESLTEKMHINNLRLYLSLDDYFTFTKYTGLDPEIGNFSFDAVGVDRGYYPTASRAMFGFSLDF